MDTCNSIQPLISRLRFKLARHNSQYVCASITPPQLVRIRHSGRARDSGREIFEKENLITQKIKEINRASPGFGSDSPFGSNRARGSLHFSGIRA